MSTDYHLACKNCKVAVWCAQDGLGGFSFYSEEPRCMKAVAALLDPVQGHGGHQIAFLPEHVIDDDDGYAVLEWPPE
jgi:hypothetical protein